MWADGLKHFCHLNWRCFVLCRHYENGNFGPAVACYAKPDSAVLMAKEDVHKAGEIRLTGLFQGGGHAAGCSITGLTQATDVLPEELAGQLSYC